MIARLSAAIAILLLSLPVLAWACGFGQPEPREPASFGTADVRLQAWDGVQPRQFQIIIAVERNMTDAIVAENHGDVRGNDDYKKDLVSGQLDELLERINRIYRRDLGVTFVFHHAQRRWIFTEEDDPYDRAPGLCGGFLVAKSQDYLIRQLGDDAPDLATVLWYCPGDPTNSRGYSHWNGLCTDARGQSTMATALSLKDPKFAIFLAHELGHLMGASHTFGIAHAFTNGDRHFEPGCGSTLMAYGGDMVNRDSCAEEQNFVESLDDFFHAYSIGEMHSKIAEAVSLGACGAPSNPAVVAVAPVALALTPLGTHIPARTPFYLKLRYAPGPGDDSVTGFTVSFDEMDEGGEALLQSDNGKGALVRARRFEALPAKGGEVVRAIPDLESLRPYPGNGEFLPQAGRELKFRMLVRAQHDYGATHAAADAQLTVVDTGREFKFLETPTHAKAGSAIRLQWDPANTERSALFAAKRVRFLLCEDECGDAGNFHQALEGDGAGNPDPGLFANDGQALVRLPSGLASGKKIRILVANEGSTFFAVSADIEVL